MKKRFLSIAFSFFVTITLFCGVASAQPAAALDWSWSFTKVTDGNGNVLAEYTGTTPTTSPLLFSVSPTIDKIIFNATLYVNQGLSDTNITFGGSALSMGTSFSSPYWSDIFDNDYRGFSPTSSGWDPANNLWLFSMPQGSYEVTPYIAIERTAPSLPAGFYQLGNDPSDFESSYIQFLPYGELELNSMYEGEGWRNSWYDIGLKNYATNYVQWTVNGSPSNAVPEPATMLLLGLSLVGLAGVRRKFKS